MFHALTDAELAAIVDLLLAELQRRLAAHRPRARADAGGPGADRPRGHRPGVRRAAAQADDPAPASRTRSRGRCCPGSSSPASRHGGRGPVVSGTLVFSTDGRPVVTEAGDAARRPRPRARGEPAAPARAAGGRRSTCRALDGRRRRRRRRARQLAGTGSTALRGGRPAAGAAAGRPARRPARALIPVVREAGRPRPARPRRCDPRGPRRCSCCCSPTRPATPASSSPSGSIAAATTRARSPSRAGARSPTTRTSWRPRSARRRRRSASTRCGRPAGRRGARPVLDPGEQFRLTPVLALAERQPGLPARAARGEPGPGTAAGDLPAAGARSDGGARRSASGRSATGPTRSTTSWCGARRPGSGPARRDPRSGGQRPARGGGWRRGDAIRQARADRARRRGRYRLAVQAVTLGAEAAGRSCRVGRCRGGRLRRRRRGARAPPSARSPSRGSSGGSRTALEAASSTNDDDRPHRRPGSVHAPCTTPAGHSTGLAGRDAAPARLPRARTAPPSITTNHVVLGLLCGSIAPPRPNASSAMTPVGPRMDDLPEVARPRRGPPPGEAHPEARDLHQRAVVCDGDVSSASAAAPAP